MVAPPAIMEAWRPRLHDHARSAFAARHGRPWRVATRALTILAVIAATLAGCYLGFVNYRQDR